MRDELLQLTQETLRFLKAEKKETLPPPPAPAPPPMKPVRKVEEVIVKVEKKRPPLLSEVEKEPMHSLIKKHLPHIQLKGGPPKQEMVAIVYEKEEALPFLEKLATAIRGRFCPVTLVPKGGALEDFSCILAFKGIEVEAEIWLESPSAYSENKALKKELWTKICQRLSPASS